MEKGQMKWEGGRGKRESLFCTMGGGRNVRKGGRHLFLGG